MSYGRDEERKSVYWVEENDVIFYFVASPVSKRKDTLNTKKKSMLVMLVITACTCKAHCICP